MIRYPKEDLPISKFNNYDESNNSIFRMSWTMTLDAGLSVLCALNDSQSIESYANEANGQLESSMDALIADGTISKGNIVKDYYRDTTKINFSKKNFLQYIKNAL